MRKFIVTTTIFRPSKAIKLFCKKKDWHLVIVGDIKTPHSSFEHLERTNRNVTYLSPRNQEKQYKKLSDTIGWNSIQRRNIGFVYAYKQDADIVATVDDDNICYPDWGTRLLVGKTAFLKCYEPRNRVFDPLSITNENYLWHRGYPIDLIQTKNKIKCVGKIKRKILVQADLWDGDPDIDAIARLTFKPIVKYSNIKEPYCSNCISPFNSQNTFIAREALPYYAVLPHIGRMDDIWGSYIFQKFFPQSVIYGPSSVFQDRNKQDLISNLEKEIIGYRNTYHLLQNLNSYEKFLPDATKRFYEIYRQSFQ